MATATVASRQHGWDEKGPRAGSSMEDPYTQLRGRYEPGEACVLFDAKHMAYRAFHTRELSDAEGRDTSALHGMLSIIQSVCQAAQTQRFILVWDGSVDYKRKAHPAYKCRHDRDRSPEEQERHERMVESVKLARKAFDDIGAPQAFCHDLEADDVAGLLTTMLESVREKVLLVSDDKDWYQLLSPKTCIFRGVVGQLVDEARFVSEFQFPPASYVDFKALVGEGAAGDNIPKVPGIGDVWGMKFIAAHGSVKAAQEFCRQRVGDGKAIAKEAAIASHGDTIKLAYKLSKIVRTGDELTKTWGFDVKRAAMIGSDLARAIQAMEPRPARMSKLLSVWSRHQIASIDCREWARDCGFQS